MAQTTLRQAIQTWQQRSELTGIGLVETTLESKLADAGCSIDATLSHLSRLAPGQLTVELAYPWGNESGNAGLLLGFFPDACTAGQEPGESWPRADAA